MSQYYKKIYLCACVSSKTRTTNPEPLKHLKMFVLNNLLLIPFRILYKEHHPKEHYNTQRTNPQTPKKPIGP